MKFLYFIALCHRLMSMKFEWNFLKRGPCGTAFTGIFGIASIVWNHKKKFMYNILNIRNDSDKIYVCVAHFTSDCFR